MLPADFSSRFPHHRFFGRLDRATSGLILFAWVGAQNALMNPTSVPDDQRVLKTYRVVVDGNVSQDTIQRLKEGFPLTVGGRHYGPTEVAARTITVLGHRIIRGKIYKTELTIAISRGIRHHVRRLFEEVKHPVRELQRIALGPVTLGDLPAGHYRELRPEEYEFIVGRFKTFTREKDRKEEALRAPVVASLWFPLVALLTVWCLGQIPPR